MKALFLFSLIMVGLACLIVFLIDNLFDDD